MEQVKNRIFKILFKLHIYGGLYCASYFIIAGFTALNFQHHFLKNKEELCDEYSAVMNLPAGISNDSLAAAVADSFELLGHVSKWTFNEDSIGNFSFRIHRPGCMHCIVINKNKGSINVRKNHTGAGSILCGMHTAITSDLDSPLMHLWAFYGRSATIIGLLAAMISIYFWFKKSVRKKSEWAMAAVASALSLFYILFIWLAG